LKQYLLATSCLILLGAIAPGQAAGPELAKLGWISGCWKGDGQTQTEEQWTKLAGGSMLGIGRTIADGKTVFYEFLQIRQRDDGIFYIAQPDGGTAVEFKLVKVNSTQAIFENLQHEFPQRIIYQRQIDDSLAAAIEGEEKGKPKRVEFAMKRVRCD
jgi:hypothetical protein